MLEEDSYRKIRSSFEKQIQEPPNNNFKWQQSISPGTEGLISNKRSPYRFQDSIIEENESGYAEKSSIKQQKDKESDDSDSLKI